MRSTITAFARFGPYHWARVEAASRALDLVALEVEPDDRTYAWEPVRAPEGVRHIVLAKEGERPGAGGTLASPEAVFAREKPAAIAIAGYADRRMLGLLAAARQHGVRTVLMSASTAQDEPRVAWREAVKSRIVRLFDAALVGGRPQADYVVELGMPRERVFLGYDVVDNAHFARPSPRPPDIAPWAGRPFFLASARFIEKKNLPRLLDAFARYRTRAGSTGWNLVLLGDGELRPELEAKAAALGLGSALLLPGFRQYPELPGWYQAASCFVHASTTEQWGLVVNEAMAAGLPVLVSRRCGCAVDLVQEGVNGFTFDPFSVDELTELLYRTAHGGLDLAAMGAASRRIIADWGPERFAQGLRDAVVCAMAQPRRKTSLADRLLLEALIRRP